MLHHQVSELDNEGDVTTATKTTLMSMSQVEDSLRSRLSVKDEAFEDATSFVKLVDKLKETINEQSKRIQELESTVQSQREDVDRKTKELEAYTTLRAASSKSAKPLRR